MMYNIHIYIYMICFSTARLTVVDRNYLAVTQRKMLRNIIGFKKAPDDTWVDMYWWLRPKLQIALQHKPIRDWSEELKLQKLRLQSEIDGSTRNPLTCAASSWNPSLVWDETSSSRPARGRGRPRTIWKSRWSCRLLFFRPRVGGSSARCSHGTFDIWLIYAWILQHLMYA